MGTFGVDHGLCLDDHLTHCTIHLSSEYQANGNTRDHSPVLPTCQVNSGHALRSVAANRLVVPSYQNVNYPSVDITCVDHSVFVITRRNLPV